MRDIEKLQNMINESKKKVFFGGTSVSTEFGIKNSEILREVIKKSTAIRQK